MPLLLHAFHAARHLTPAPRLFNTTTLLRTVGLPARTYTRTAHYATHTYALHTTPCRIR